MQARLHAWANCRRAFAHAADSQAVDEQREMLASSKSKMEAQHVALLAVGAARTRVQRRMRRADALAGKQRDEAKAKAAELVRRIPRTVFQQARSLALRAAVHAEQQHDAAVRRACSAGGSACRAQSEAGELLG